jgi:hypothetical protein
VKPAEGIAKTGDEFQLLGRNFRIVEVKQNGVCTERDDKEFGFWSWVEIKHTSEGL